MPNPAALFRDLHGRPPSARVDAPGRVNLMGDHIDYNGLSVLPMALHRRVTILVRPRSDALVRVATTASGFEPREFEVDASLTPFPAGDWGNYAKAAINDLVRDGETRHGFDAVVHSDIPVAAGLSSSSALVVGFALAWLYSNRRPMAPLELADRMAAAEHFVGTRGGGMDQAICLGASAGAACRIDFRPLHLECHPVPSEWTFLLAASGVRAEKSGRARSTYNARTSECRDAIRSVNPVLGHGADEGWKELLGRHTVNVLIGAAEDVLVDALFRRFRHVVTEADRVGRCESALRQAAIVEFGRLLDESHESLAHDYEVSIRELDELVDLAQQSGAHGARLTGAGFGGCVVALCHAEGADDVRRALVEGYYVPRDLDPGAMVFAARPGAGARVTEL